MSGIVSDLLIGVVLYVFLVALRRVLEVGFTAIETKVIGYKAKKIKA